MVMDSAPLWMPTGMVTAWRTVGGGDGGRFDKRAGGVGRTGLPSGVEGETDRVESRRTVRVTSATMTLVALDEHFRPTPILASDAGGKAP